MATTPQDFMKTHLEAMKKEALTASPERRQEMMEALVLAVSDVMADKGMPHEALSEITPYLRGTPGDADLYRRLSASANVMHESFTALATAQGEEAQGRMTVMMRTVTLNTLIQRALAAASSPKDDELYMPTAWNAMLDAMNLSNLMGGLARFASAWQHRLGGTRPVTGFWVGSAGSA